MSLISWPCTASAVAAASPSSGYIARAAGADNSSRRAMTGGHASRGAATRCAYRELHLGMGTAEPVATRKLADFRAANATGCRLDLDRESPYGVTRKSVACVRERMYSGVIRQGDGAAQSIGFATRRRARSGVQAAVRCRDDTASRMRWDRGRHRTVLGEREMRPRAHVVSHVGRKKPTQACLLRHDHMVEALAPDRADDALDVGVLPRRAWGRSDGLTVYGGQRGGGDRGEDGKPTFRCALTVQREGMLAANGPASHRGLG
jgi:hypothetical protein